MAKDKRIETKLSRELSYYLRHAPDALGLHMDSKGYVSVKELLENWNKTKTVTMKQLREIVASDAKNRYSFRDGERYIRANQGHSLPWVNLGLEEEQPPEFLYHGTALRNLKAIRAEGLCKMKRNHVHLTDNYDTAWKTGARHGEAVVLVIEAGRMSREGCSFFLSENHVWLTEQVPRQYILFPENQFREEMKKNRGEE